MRIAVPCLAALLLLGGCGEQPEEKPAREPATDVEQAARNDALTQWYRGKAAEQKRSLAIRARTFRDAVTGLLQSPEPQRLATARETWRGLYQAWNHARVPLYCRAELDVDTARRLRRTDPLPVFPGYIDGLSQWPDSGIVNDVTVTLSEQELLAQQGATAEGEVSLGFQVIHFLLHGEPGVERTATAFMPVTEAPEGTDTEVRQLPENRRRRYLEQATAILTRDLAAMTSGQTPLVTADLLVESLRQVTEKLIQLENLANATEVAGEYLAPAVREQASTALRESLAAWSGPDTPLMAALEHQQAGAASLRDALKGIKGDMDMAALQALHAELAAVSDRLRGNRQARN